jgi:ATP-dependent RNA helicase RhlB
VPVKTVVVAETVADLPAAAEAMAADSAPKKRRRRGGRGRSRREGGDGAPQVRIQDANTAAAPRAVGAEGGNGNGNRRPSRHVAASRPAASPAPAAAPVKKEGFFRRLGRIFGGK